ncbi:hypothetical protein [Sulfitobacter pontiacus]|uniref:hypothetical protein n=1 Tax=Sulfitobacter pontiacus TaxID=60137 RepID=UPI0030EECF80
MNANDTLLEAMDDLSRVRDMLELLSMTTQGMPDAEQNALATGTKIALDFLALAQTGLKEHQAELSDEETTQ